jgi:hypothetical protein
MAASMSLEQVTAAKKEGQRELTSALNNCAPATHWSGLKDAVKTL